MQVKIHGTGSEWQYILKEPHFIDHGDLHTAPTNSTTSGSAYIQCIAMCTDNQKSTSAAEKQQDRGGLLIALDV